MTNKVSIKILSVFHEKLSIKILKNMVQLTSVTVKVATDMRDSWQELASTFHPIVSRIYLNNNMEFSPYGNQDTQFIQIRIFSVKKST